jgi:hypothetical protein
VLIIRRINCIDTIDSPDDEHEVDRNMYRIEINTQKRTVRQVDHLPKISICGLH